MRSNICLFDLRIRKCYLLDDFDDSVLDDDKIMVDIEYGLIFEPSLINKKRYKKDTSKNKFLFKKILKNIL